MKRLLTLVLIVGFAFGMELNQVNVKVEGNILRVDGKSYNLSKDVKVQNQFGEELPTESLNAARSIKLEFDQGGNVKLIKVLGWWD
ncbi:MAG: hypothetical protein ACK4FY_07135 [Aquificaceae bacterium]